MPEFKKHKIIFFGTPEFAVPSLKKLIEAGFEIPLVITQPDKPVGRGNKITESPVKLFAKQNGLAVRQPARISKEIELIDELKALEPDLMVTAAFGQILSQEIIDIPKWGIWNVHASLLPRWRGAAPINWALLKGDNETGVTIMQTEKGLDTGPMLLKKSLLIATSDNTETLTKKLAEIGAEALVEAINLKLQDKLLSENQNDSEATYAHKIKKEDGQIVISQISSIDEVIRKEKAFSPWPGIFVKDTSTEQDVQLFGVSLSALSADFEKYSSSELGSVVSVNNKDGSFDLKLLKSILNVKEVKAPAKNKMRAADWLRGLKVDWKTLKFD